MNPRVGGVWAGIFQGLIPQFAKVGAKGLSVPIADIYDVLRVEVPQIAEGFKDCFHGAPVGWHRPVQHPPDGLTACGALQVVALGNDVADQPQRGRPASR